MPSATRWQRLRVKVKAYLFHALRKKALPYRKLGRNIVFKRDQKFGSKSMSNPFQKL